ncbi:hypothetical protein ABKS89_30475 [Pseudomonas sp. LABIM340]|nr:hypothetical protein [Pseudomonas nitroreducens]
MTGCYVLCMERSNSRGLLIVYLSVSQGGGDHQINLTSSRGCGHRPLV